MLVGVSPSSHLRSGPLRADADRGGGRRSRLRSSARSRRSTRGASRPTATASASSSRVGLGAAAACVGRRGLRASFAALVALLFLAGALGASVDSSSGRAVMHWFGARERGLALGVRQTSVPIGGVWVALGPAGARLGRRPARRAARARGRLPRGAIVGLVVLREGDADAVAARPRSRRRRSGTARIWVLSGGSALLVAPQACLVGFLVVFLHGEPRLSTVQAGGRARRGQRARDRDADRRRALVGPRRQPARCRCGWIALALTASSSLLRAAVLRRRCGSSCRLLVVTGCVAISWNGLAFAAVAEAAGHARSGSAIGIQQTALAVSGASCSRSRSARSSPGRRGARGSP